MAKRRVIPSRNTSRREKKTKNNNYMIKARRSRMASRRLSRKSSRKQPKSKYMVNKNKTATSNKAVFSGTIIYSGEGPLNPFNWTPQDKNNKPSKLNWSNVAPGTHCLDKLTSLVWIIDQKEKMSLAPCQTVQILHETVPKPLSNFNPAMCVFPILPEIRRIPTGTKFTFANSSNYYILDKDKKLQEMDLNKPEDRNRKSSPTKKPSCLRPSMMIPVAFNSLYNTQNLVGLDTPVENSPVQKPREEGYSNLQEWITGLVRGNDQDPGLLTDLKIEMLQHDDVLHFYDPNTVQNPMNENGKNPDGSDYIEDYHESGNFSFKLRVIRNSKGVLVANMIN